jgi:flagellar motor protein MotB
MRIQLSVLALVAILHAQASWGQPVPIYQVTVIERTVKAVSYQYRGGQTQVDFAGTVLLPQAHGTAIVESKSGRTQIDARFSNLAAPNRFGGEYLTYVLWAITPEGHAKNLGEVLSNSADRGHLSITTDLQTFGMIVTAEPYSAVRQPSNVVVLENVVRADTIGRTEPILAKYELLPRGHYTYTLPEGPPAGGPKVSMSRYESLLEIYQAQNAVQIARAQGADRYARETLAKAESLLAEARQMEERHAGGSTVVTLARQAAQTAEDARAVTIQQKQVAQVAEVRAALAQERERREAAERAAHDAAAQASEERTKLAEEHAQREHDDAVALAASAPKTEPEVVVVPPGQPPERKLETRKTEARMKLMQSMNTYFVTNDTPRGLVVALPDRDFRGAALDPAVSARLGNLAALLAVQPGLRIEVDGHGEEFSSERAEAVRSTLLRGGIPADAVVAAGLGTSRPWASNATASGREQNRRIEIIVSGAPIGTLASWDRTYTIR